MDICFCSMPSSENQYIAKKGKIMSHYIKVLTENELEEVTEEALNKAFRHIQDRIGVESGDFACAWAHQPVIDAFKQWFKDYAKAERVAWQEEQDEQYEVMLKNNQ